MFFRKGKIKEKAELLLSDGREILNSGNNLPKAYELINEAETLFRKLKDEGKKQAQTCQAFLLMIEGYRYKDKEQFIDSMKSFGKANVQFTAVSEKELALKVREEQARAQVDFAKAKAIEGDFEEASRLFESAGAVFQMAGMVKEAASARARSFVQRAARVDDDFEKARFLKKAVEQFREARESQIMVEAHALFYEGRALTRVNIRESIQCLVRAADKYEAAGATARVQRVRQIIQELTEEVKQRPSEYGVSYRY
ncbi:MAG: hypothetical protein ACXAC7_14030 [Candidatus Hodarchaeales archaeon]